MSEPFVGQIMMSAFGFAPRGYAQCNGQVMPVNQNAALYSLLGTQYGGSGNTTFNLPDLRGRSPCSALGSVDPNWVPGAYAFAGPVGVEAVTLAAAQIAPHQHMMVASANAAGDGIASDGSALGTSDNPIYAKASPTVPLGGGPLGPVGGAPHPNMQPFLTISMCIALNGYYPSRN